MGWQQEWVGEKWKVCVVKCNEKNCVKFWAFWITWYWQIKPFHGNAFKNV